MSCAIIVLGFGIRGMPSGETMNRSRSGETVARAVRAVLKGLAVIPVIAAYSASSAILRLLSSGERARRRRLTRNTSAFSRFALRLLGIRVAVSRARGRSDRGGRGRLVVANHLSWVDILVLSSVMPSVFITSVELKDTFFPGFFARLAGCLFVERRSPSGLRREIEEIARVLQDGFTVVLFPEGTTSNGETVRAFKAALFDAAIRANAPVLPVCLRYHAVDGRPVTARNRDRIFYYGGVRFIRHLPRVLSLRSAGVDLAVLRTIPVHARRSRRNLTALIHEIVSACYHGRRDAAGPSPGGRSAGQRRALGEARPPASGLA